MKQLFVFSLTGIVLLHFLVVMAVVFVSRKPMPRFEAEAPSGDADKELELAA